MTRFVFVLATALVAPAAVSAGRPDATHFDRSRLLIGTYCLAPHERDEAHVRDLRDCGIDFLYGIPANDRATLDLFAKYGIGVIATGAVPFWHGMDGSQAGQMAEKQPLEKFEAAIAAYRPHPAIWAVDVVDEPSALDFPHIARVLDCLKPRLGGAIPYLNLYPNYASVVQNSGADAMNQLGTKTYAEHVSRYVEQVPLDYISYDFYLYSVREDRRAEYDRKFYDNFKIVADAARRTGKGFWFIPQVNSCFENLWPSVNMLRYQAFTSMAFGAEVINWACWGIEQRKETFHMSGLIGWWTNNVLTLEGHRTRQYEKLKVVNAELHALGPAYMRYRSVATHFTGFASEKGFDGIGIDVRDAADAGPFRGIRADDGSALVIGEMVSRRGDGARAVFIVGSDDPYDVANRDYRVVFRAEGNVRALCPSDAVVCRREADGSWSVPIRSNAAVLVESGF